MLISVKKQSCGATSTQKDPDDCLKVNKLPRIKDCDRQY